MVLNQTEAVIMREITPMDRRIEISWDFDKPERFSRWGGYAQIISQHTFEDLYYGKGPWVYRENAEIHAVSGSYIPSGTDFDLDGPIIPNGLAPTNENVWNTTTLIGQNYTMTGVLSVGGVVVDFSVEHFEGETNKARFFFSRPDLFQVELSYLDADTGTLRLYPIGFGMNILSMNFKKAMLDSEGQIQRRVSVLTDLRRGLRDTGVCTHHKGSFIRGYIMAEHHAISAKAALAVQKHIGANFSEDTDTLDFRLRDLSELCVEGEDWPCPEITFDFRPVEVGEGDDECVVINTYEFTLTVDGEFNSFGIFFGDGQSVNDDLTPTHAYPPNSRVEPSAFASNENCRVATASFEDQAQSIGEIPEIPGLVCPEIIIPDIPAIPEALIPNFNAPTTIVNIETPDVTGFSFQSIDFSQSIFISIPNTINVNTSFGDINISIPPITIDITFPDPPDITVNFSVNIDYPPEAGPCFALVPCGGYCHGS